jgi:hypothetical protein
MQLLLGSIVTGGTILLLLLSIVILATDSFFTYKGDATGELQRDA